IQRPLHIHTDHSLWTDSEIGKMMRELIRTSLKLGVCQLPVSEDHSHCIGASRCLLGEQLENALVPRIICLCFIPLAQQPTLLGIAQERKFRYLPICTPIRSYSGT